MEKFKVNFIQFIVDKLHDYGIGSGVDIFIACQFALESDFGRSRLVAECFNYCGMRSPKVRITCDLFPGSTWATYDNLDMCIFDYVVWLSWNHFTQLELQNVPLFITHLVKSGYCPEKDYISKITTIYNQFNSFTNGK